MKLELFSQKLPGADYYKGYFAVFEGQDGSGKSTIIASVGEILQSKGYKVKIVPEFSSSLFGRYLLDSVSKDKFLRAQTQHPTFLTQVFAFFSDWMFLTEYEIIPALEAGMIVLKDRYTDSQVVCQIPTLLDEYNGEIGRLKQWFEEVTGINPVIPNRVFYIDVPEEVRITRIKNRNREFSEALADTVSGSDLRIFRERDFLYGVRMRDNKALYTTIRNTQSVSTSADLVVDRILRDTQDLTAKGKLRMEESAFVSVQEGTN
ncbi:MAG: hypothetical protein Q7S44_03000 [bacterium]|nr:hypothetical protein [bacterium]